MLGATIKNDPGVMILENSISSKSQGKYKKTDPSKTSPIHYPKKDELNNWEYCNPSNFEDQLPQPYRFINRCLNEMLLNNVYEQVFEIEKYKSNVNYEGLVKEIVSSGTFEIEGVSCLASSFENPTNHLFAGDYYGNIFLLDLNKKIQTAKISVSPGKRVISISANTLKDDDSITTLCVICRGDPMLHVYRYKAGESKLFKNFTICLLKKNEILDKNTPLSLFPYACKISSESKFVILVLYNGNIEIFLLPEPQQALQSNSQSQSDFKLGPKQPSKPVDIINKPSQQPPMIILDTAITEITEPFYSITAKIPLKKKTYEETLNSFIQSVEKKNVDEPIDPKLLTKDNKKIAVPPPDPKKPSPNALKQEAPTIINSEYAQLLGDIIKNDKDADISPNYEVFRNRAEVFFISEKLCVPNDIKTFSKIKEFDVITGIAIVWMGQKFVDFHRIQSLSKENIPTYIQQRINPTTIITEEKSIKQELQMTAAKVDTLKKPTTPNPPQNTNSKPNEIKNQQYVTFEKKITKSFDVLYDISIATVNKSNTFLALGLIDGSVFIYDILLCQEHCYLDKHVSEVTHIKFFEDWTVVSGSADGVVHIYNLKESRLEMKRTNIFMSNNLEIRGLEISEQGLALVIDNQFNARVYDIVHHEKIMRLLPVSIMDQIKKQWCLWPNPIISAQKGIMIKNILLCII